jgi:hypothetical protein
MAVVLSSYSTLYNDANLKHYYPLDGDANDAKGTVNGTVGTVTFGTAYGTFTQGGTFNNNGWINFGTLDAQFPVTDSTWWCWAQTGDTSASWHSLWNKQDICTIAMYGGELRSYVWSSGSVVTTGKTISDNAWHFLVLTYKYNTSGGGKLYLDGSTTPVATFDTGTGTFYKITAGANATPTQYFKGCLDDIAYFDRVLTGAEINSYYTYTGAGASAALTGLIGEGMMPIFR